MTLLTEADRKYIVQEILAELERQRIVDQTRDDRKLDEMAERMNHIANALETIEKSRVSFLRGVWRALCHGWGVAKVEIDKLFKDNEVDQTKEGGG
jgi:predicted secreted protein